MLAELARMGARLIIQRAVEEEFDSWLGRARYERRPDGPPASATGFVPDAPHGCLSDSLPPFAARCRFAYAAARPTPRRCRVAARSTRSAPSSTAAGSGGSRARIWASTSGPVTWSFR
jgi:hypothetical protein